MQTLLDIDHSLIVLMARTESRRSSRGTGTGKEAHYSAQKQRAREKQGQKREMHMQDAGLQCAAAFQGRKVMSRSAQDGSPLIGKVARGYPSCIFGDFDIPSSWKKISHGTVHIHDKYTGFLSAVVRITPIADLSDRERTELDTNIAHVLKDAKLHHGCSINSAANTEHGQMGHMGNIGFRKAMVPNQPFSIYTSLKARAYAAEQSTLRKSDYLLHLSLGSRFCSLVPEVFRRHRAQMLSQELPLMGYRAAEIAEAFAEPNLFTPAVAYSTKGVHAFANEAHKDNDDSQFAYVQWWPISKGLRLGSSRHDKYSLALEPICQIGGCFYNATYGWYIDFGDAGNALVECTWDARRQVHGTATAIYHSLHNHIGISAQINHRLACAVELFNKTPHCDRDYKPIQDQVYSSLARKVSTSGV